MKKKINWGLIILLAVLSILFLVLLGSFIFSRIEIINITGNAVNDGDLLQNLLVPSAITSIIFSMVGLIEIAFLVWSVRTRGASKIFPFKGYLTAISIVIVIFLINYFITLFPYGNIVLLIVSFVLQIMIYGVLLPYILIAQISYIILLLEGNIKGIIS